MRATSSVRRADRSARVIGADDDGTSVEGASFDAASVVDFVVLAVDASLIAARWSRVSLGS